MQDYIKDVTIHNYNSLLLANKDCYYNNHISVDFVWSYVCFTVIIITV